MGSFNVACSISNLTINVGDETYYIPLLEPKYPEKVYIGNAFLLYGECFYQPATLPLLGVYDDYGYVTDVEDGEHSEMLAEFFGIDRIEQLINDEESKKLKGISSGMYVLKPIYDAISENVVDDLGNSVLASIISAFGKFQKKVDDKKRKIEEYTKNAEEAKTEEDKKGWLQLKAVEETLFGTFDGYHPFRNYTLFNEIYQDKFFEEYMRDKLLKFIMFESGMAACNQFYFPARNGYQFGNADMDLKLAKAVVEVANKRIVHNV